MSTEMSIVVQKKFQQANPPLIQNEYTTRAQDTQNINQSQKQSQNPQTQSRNPQSKSENNKNFILYKNTQAEGIFEEIQYLKKCHFIFEILIYLLSGGIFFLLFKWNTNWKKVILYKVCQNIEDATHVYIIGPAKSLHIEEIKEKNVEDKLIKTFSFRYFRFKAQNNIFIPLCDQVCEYTNNNLLKKFSEGLNTSQIKTSSQKNGLNESKIPEPSYFAIFLDQILTPFYLFQIFSVILWYFEKYNIYASVILISATFSLIIELFQTKQNIRKIVKLSENQKIQIKVLRNNVQTIVSSENLTFGDVCFLETNSIIPCDFAVIRGSAIVSEAMLTGESIPVIKTLMENSDELFQENKQSIIYSGSRILQLDQLKCIVIRTSFDTLKGNLLRSIMFPLKPNQFSFQKQSMKFIIILGFNALIAFLITIPKFIELLDQQAILPVDVVIRILDLITISVPPALPTCLAFGVSFSLRRLKKQNIFCINPPKINACGKVKTVCFDKTGTLTEEGLSFKRIICYEKKELKEIEALNLIEMGNYIHRIIISACHTIENFNNELIGDPLDIEMFKYSGFYIAESGQNGQILVEKNTQKLKIQILKRFQFLAELQKASVIAEFEGNKYIFSKGSPEKIVQQCKQESIPHNYKEVLEQYTLSGYRVIGISFSEIQNFQEGEKRDYYEKNHVFAGFLIFENELKDVTKYHINLLNSQNIRSIMVTGDNPLTATYVAKQCDIIEFEQQSNILEYLNNECILNNKKFEIEKKLDQLDGKQLTVTGTFFKQYIEDNFNLRRFILKNTKVYARMTPDQKQNLISFIQQENENVHTFTGMCGDGANDCGALKEADMGISLSNTDTSIAAPFTSKVQNIACVHRLLREGRASLQTSFECFKYMALYSIIQCFTTTILYYQQSFPADKQFLMWDLFIILPLSFLLGMGKPSQKLKKQTPTCELISAEVIISIIGQSAIQLGVQLFTIGILVKQSWYMNTLDINKDSDGEINYDNLSGCYDSTALYWVTNFQYIFMVIAYSIDSKHKKKFYTNFPFFVFLVFIIGFSLFIIFQDFDGFTEFFEIVYVVKNDKGDLQSEMPYSFRWIILGIILVNLFINIVFESLLLPVFVKLFNRNNSVKKQQVINDQLDQEIKV